MKKLKVIKIEDKVMFFGLTGKHPCLLSVNDLSFHDVDPVMSMNITWIDTGRYSKRQLKNMLRRTMNSILRSAVNDFKAKSGI